MHTDEEVSLLLKINEVNVMQKMMLESFNDHVKDDDKHFAKLYDADEKILSEINKIPYKMTQCSEKIKTDVLTVARHEFTSETEFRVFKTWIITGISVGTIFATVLSALINVYLKVG